MDRAHRLGQKRVVNVYRLITRDTLEEKIMGLQRFKLNIANTVINEENAGGGLRGMGNEEILDLFQVGKGAASGKRHREDDLEDSRKKQKGLTSIAGVPQALLDDLAGSSSAQEEYEKEFDFGSFLSSMKGT